MLTVKLNGCLEILPVACSLAEALAIWNRDKPYVAVAVNFAIVPRSQFAARQLQENDEIEIVEPMQGG